jgi:hypothetical protein
MEAKLAEQMLKAAQQVEEQLDGVSYSMFVQIYFLLLGNRSIGQIGRR